MKPSKTPIPLADACSLVGTLNERSPAVRYAVAELLEGRADCQR